MPHIAPEVDLSIAAQIQLRSIEEDLTCLLDAFDVPALQDREKRIYIGAENKVLYHYRAFFSSADPKTFQRFIGFIAASGQPGNRNKLERNDPLAMALMGRMLVLLNGLDHAW